MKRFVIVGFVIIIIGTFLLIVGINFLSILSRQTTLLEITITDFTNPTIENQTIFSVIRVREGNKFGPRDLSAKISNSPFKLLQINSDQNTISVSIMEELMYSGENAVDTTRLVTTENTCFLASSLDTNKEICIRVI